MLAILPVSEAELGWLGVIILSVACAGVWGPHGPLLSWPAKILDGTAAAAGSTSTDLPSLAFPINVDYVGQGSSSEPFSSATRRSCNLDLPSRGS